MSGCLGPADRAQSWNGRFGPNLTDRAGTAAIQVFGKNLHQLLMAPPVKGKVTLGVDPGFRTGCKLAVVDETGKVLDTGVGHFTLPGTGRRPRPRAKAEILALMPQLRRHGDRHRQRHRRRAEAEQFIAGRCCRSWADKRPI